MELYLHIIRTFVTFIFVHLEGGLNNFAIIAKHFFNSEADSTKMSRSASIKHILFLQCEELKSTLEILVLHYQLRYQN